MRTSEHDDPFGDWESSWRSNSATSDRGPLARQLGASVYLKAAVPQRMELCVSLLKQIYRRIPSANRLIMGSIDPGEPSLDRIGEQSRRKI